MTTATFSPNQAAEQIGVSPATIKNWAVRLPVPSVVQPDGERRFPPEALAVLETVKQLRGDERSYATIRRLIAPEDGGPAAPAADDVLGALRAELAAAARRINRLEARVDALMSEKVALEAERDAIEIRLTRLERGKPFPRWRLFGR